MGKSKNKSNQNHKPQPSNGRPAQIVTSAAGGLSSAPSVVTPVPPAPPPAKPEDVALSALSVAQRAQAAELAQRLPLPASRDEGLERLREAEAAYQLKVKEHEAAALELEQDLDRQQDELKKRQGELDQRQRDQEAQGRKLERDMAEREARLQKQLADLAEREARLQKQRGELDERREQVSAEQANVKDARKKAEQERRETEERLQAQKKHEEQLLAQEQQLLAQKANAEAGFVAERRAALAKLLQERDAVRKEMEDAQARRDAEAAQEHERRRAAQEEAARQREEGRRQLDAELTAQRERAESELADRRAAQEAALRGERERQEAALRGERERQEAALRDEREQHRTALREGRDRLVAERAALEAERAQLRREQQRLRVDQDEVREDREDLDRLVQQRAAAELEAAAAERRALEERLAAARGHGDRLDAQLRAREDADRRFGQRTPDEVLAELEAVRAERDRLTQQLAERPDRQATERLRALENERAEREQECHGLRQQNEQLQSKLSRHRVGAAEAERLRDQNTALESHNQLLRGHLDDLKAEVGRRLGDTTSKACFPALLGLDEDPRQQERPALDDGPVVLGRLVTELQRDIAARQRLYYKEADLRCFLAGLSASRLLLLQGISGTGKTSLPRAVADALLWGHDKIEVQAGWRDRDDLIGHYNAFERRFHERPFLQALYRAQGPALAERPFLLVLDEMNLSHPEQYFADLLSALEEPDPERRVLRLLTSAQGAKESWPRLLREGRDLWLPANLWFVGTANHDETTKDFADKTYDRSHVMELLRHPPAEPAGEVRPERLQPLSLRALDRAFERARRDQAAAAQKVQSYIDQHLAKLLDERFRIGIGNRLERQIRDFVPVVVAAGGTVAEAADHLLSTKLLRRLRDRYDVVEQDLRDLKQVLAVSWKDLANGAGPGRAVRAQGLLDRELARLGQRGEGR